MVQAAVYVSPVTWASLVAVLLTPRAVPDNYTDEKTFLDHLQRNPRLQPDEFWSLMADSTVIVQHLASVALFCCCFVAIIQGNVSPVAVVGCASLCTVGAWVLWDRWMGLDVDAAAAAAADGDAAARLGISRYQQRLATAKSAVLIYAALLGLSPILKSLTRSTSSDSIWALSTWLLMMNVAFFDYGSASGARYGLVYLYMSTSMYETPFANDAAGFQLPSQPTRQ